MLSRLLNKLMNFQESEMVVRDLMVQKVVKSITYHLDKKKEPEFSLTLLTLTVKIGTSMLQKEF